MAIPNWVVISVKPNPDYTLDITFADGSRKIYNAAPLLSKPIYSELNNPGFFLLAKAACGTVVWNDDVDIAPEHLYECGQDVTKVIDKIG